MEPALQNDWDDAAWDHWIRSVSNYTLEEIVRSAQEPKYIARSLPHPGAEPPRPNAEQVLRQQVQEAEFLTSQRKIKDEEPELVLDVMYYPWTWKKWWLRGLAVPVVMTAVLGVIVAFSVLPSQVVIFGGNSIIIAILIILFRD